MEDAHSKSFCSEFFRTADLEQQYDTVSHFGSIFSFNSTIQSGVSYSAGYASLPLPSCPSYWTHTSVHYIRRDALFYFTLSAYPGLFHLAGFSLCVGPHLLLLSGSISYAVFYTPALSLRLIRLIFWGPTRSTSSTAPLHFQENLRRLGQRSRCVVRFHKASPEQPTSRTADSIVKYYL